jgi:hypothetical protein
MMNPFRVTDNWILARCTTFAHWFQRLTGRTTYFIAKQGRFITFCSGVFNLADYFLKLSADRPSIINAALTAFVIVLLAHDGKLCDEADRHVQSGADTLPKGIAASIRYGLFWRLLWISFTARYTVKLIWVTEHRLAVFTENVLWCLGVVIFFYFVAVVPLPPGKSKVREWIESFQRGKLSPVRAQS